MIRRFLLITGLLSFGFLAHAEIFSINKFSGINTDDSTLTLSNGQTPDSANTVTDNGPGLQGRRGYVRFSTEPATSIWEFPLSNGTRYIIVNTGGGFLKADTGDGVFNVMVGTVPTDRIVSGSVLGDRFYYVDTLNGLKYWNGSAVTVASAALTFDNLVTWKGRLAGSGITANARVIYLSKYLDGTSWTAPTNPSDDDAAQITVAGSLDETIQALYASFQDKLMWFKYNSFGGIYGSRRSNFIQRTFSDNIGVSSKETIRDCDGLLRWLGRNKNVWEFDGSTYKKISEEVDTLFADISQGDSTTKSNTQTTAAHWDAGSQTPSSPVNFITTTQISGSLTPKTTYFIDTNRDDWAFGSESPNSTAFSTDTAGQLDPVLANLTVSEGSEFGAGTFDNGVFLDTQTTSGQIQTTFPDTFDYVRDGNNGTKNVWVAQNATSNGATFTDESLSDYISGSVLTFTHSGTSPSDLIHTVQQVPAYTSGATYYFVVNGLTNSSPSTGNLIFMLRPTTATTPALIGTGDRYSFALAGDGSTMTVVNLRNDCGLSLTPGGSFVFPSTVSFYISSTQYQLKINGTNIASGSSSCDLGQTYVYLWLAGDGTAIIDNFTVNPQTGTYTSQGGDTSIITPTWSTFTATTGGSAAFTYTSAVSADNSTFDSAVSATSGNSLTSNKKRYVKIAATFNHNITTFPGSPSYLSEFNIKAYSTGTFTSRAVDTGMTIPQWGPFVYSTTPVGTGGNISFYTQASADGSSWDARVAATNNVQVASAEKRYIRYQIDLIPTGYDNYTSVLDVTITGKSTGTYTTQSIFVGPSISAWGPVVVNGADTGGSYTIQFGTSPDGVTYGFTTITNNTTPSVSISSYAAIRIIFDLDNATDTPRVDDITITWLEGSTVRASSVFYRQRYWLGVAVSSTANNRVHLFDRDRQWQKYTGINADSMGLYNSQFYFGNTTGLYSADTGYSDNGSTITAYYKSADFILSSPDYNNLFDSLYLTTENSDSTIQTTYQVNGIGTDYSLASYQMNTNSGIQNFKLPFYQTEVQQAKLINLKWTVAGSSFWRFLNGTLYYQPQRLPD